MALAKAIVKRMGSGRRGRNDRLRRHALPRTSRRDNMKGMKSISMTRALTGAAVLFGLALMAVTAFAVDLKHVSADELKKMIETKADVVIVDVQPKGAYNYGHIKGAINLPWAQEMKGPVKLPKNRMLVLYCDCTHEEDSTSAATQLVEKYGYSADKVRLLKGGWSGWVKLGYPVEKGKTK
jgi:rhodanese-related sulfurtransferase